MFINIKKIIIKGDSNLVVKQIKKEYKIESQNLIGLFNKVNDELSKFAQKIEKVCIECVENGAMTKDLAILIGPSSKYLTTNQFLDEIDGNLKAKLN